MSDYADLRAALDKTFHALLIDDPDIIRALLAERDSLRKSLQECARIIQLDRDSLSDTHRDPATGKVEDRLGREGLAEYDGALALARAALAQEQGD